MAGSRIICPYKNCSDLSLKTNQSLRKHIETVHAVPIVCKKLTFKSSDGKISKNKCREIGEFIHFTYKVIYISYGGSVVLKCTIPYIS